MPNFLHINSYITNTTKALLAIVCLCLAANTYAFQDSAGDDDTILIERAPSDKISYSTAVKAFAKSVLNFDVDQFFSGGKNCKDAVVRNFSQLSERTRYKLNLKHDQLEVKLTLNF